MGLEGTTGIQPWINNLFATESLDIQWNSSAQFGQQFVTSEQKHADGTLSMGLVIHENGIPSTSKQTRILDVPGPAVAIPSHGEDGCYLLSDLEDEPYEDSKSICCSGDPEDCLTNTKKKGKQCWKREVEESKKLLGHEEEIEDTNYNKKRAKRGQGDPTNWRRNKAKLLRKAGKEYKGIRKGKNGSKYEIIDRNPRKMGERCDSKKCKESIMKRRCAEITEEQRQELFDGFWSSMDWKERKTFINTLVTVLQKANTENCRRKVTLFYHLKVNDIILPVCRKMFLSTFSLGEWSVLNWVKNSQCHGIVRQSSSSPNRRKTN